MKPALKLGLIHALIDTASGAIVYAEIVQGRISFESIGSMIIVYNALAFGTQFVVGWIADYRRAYRYTALSGIWIMLLALVVQKYSHIPGVILAGIGNSLFHVGAGAIVLQQSDGKACDAGIFVAPGAIGLVIGLWLGVQTFAWQLILAPLLILSAVMVSQLPAGLDAPTELKSAKIPIFPILVCVSLLLMSVSVRGTVGGFISGAWRDSQTAVFLLAFAAVAGKALGGMIADRIGWKTLSVSALLVSCPFIVFGTQHIMIALTGMFFFQLTMPVTLEAVYLAFPNRAGFAFGLPCLALLIGALPGLTGFTAQLNLSRFIIPVVFLSAGMIFFGLRFLKGK